jgi:hypothetical protein
MSRQVQKKLADWRNHAVQIDACPVCNGAEFRQVLKGDRYDMGLVNVVCSGCGFVFCDPYPSEVYMEDFYKNYFWKLYFGKSTQANERILKSSAIRCLSYGQFIQNGVIGKGGGPLSDIMFVDIGGGEGHWTRWVRDNWGGHTVLIEPNDSERMRAMEKGRANQCFSSISELLEKVDLRTNGQTLLISLIHVLEHIPNLLQVMSQLRSLSREGDYIYIDVPDLDRYEHIKEFHIAHKWHFSSDTLARLFSNFQFKLIGLEQYDPIDHPRSIRALFQRVDADNFSIMCRAEESCDLESRFKAIQNSEARWNHWLSKLRRLGKELLGR